VVVNLWGSWCGPCRREAPELTKAARRFGRRVQFLGVDLQDSRTEARLFIRDAGWPYPSVFDSPRAILTGLGLLGTPITLVFDRQGHRVATFNGPVGRARDLERVLRRVV
jgi:thiol-disulfide isomerase/thioredoxin